MRFLIASDIHLEHGSPERIPQLPDPSEYDIVLLPGDIHSGSLAISWAEDFFPKDKPVYYVPGNHEYYGYPKELIDYRIAERCKVSTHVHALNPGAVILEDKYVLIGATLWSRLSLKGRGELPDIRVENSIADFSRIVYKNDLFSADHCRELFETEYDFIAKAIKLAVDSELTPIVMTHFVPTQDAIHERFQGDALNAYFTNDCDDLMSAELPLWVFGHSHVRMDFMHYTGTRIVSNAFGYPREWAMDDPVWKIVEV